MTPSNGQKVLILGGGYAGALAAARLAHKGLPVQITLVDASDSFVERIRLHQMAVGQRVPRRPMTAMLPATVQFCHGRVVELDLARQSVALETPSGRAELDYDWLIYALGSSVDTQTVPGVAEYAHALGSPEAAEGLRAALQMQAEQGGRVLVVGGGLTGIEVVTEIAESFPGLDVQLLTGGELGADLSPRGQAHLAGVMARLGVHGVDRTRVTRLTPGEAHLADGGAVAFDICVWTAGFSVSPLAEQAGLVVNRRGQIVTDDALRAQGQNRVFAVGDAAEVKGVTADPLRMACATAMPMAAHVADNVARLLRGEAPRRFRFGYVVRCISLGRREALVQAVDADDRPTDRIVTGRVAALIKEGICRLVVGVIQAERSLGKSVYAWSQPRRRDTRSRAGWRERSKRGSYDSALSGL